MKTIFFIMLITIKLFAFSNPTNFSTNNVLNPISPYSQVGKNRTIHSEDNSSTFYTKEQKEKALEDTILFTLFLFGLIGLFLLSKNLKKDIKKGKK